MFRFIKDIPRRAGRVREKLKTAYQCMTGPYFRCVPPGHFYSPLPDMEEVERRSQKIFVPAPTRIGGIDLRSEEQKQLLWKFEGYYSSPPFERSFNPKSRFFRPNGAFPYQDAFTLSAMIRHFKPQRLIEIGCGFSSCVILDTCEAISPETKLTFIEPYPELLLSRIRPSDTSRFELKKELIQDVDLKIFAELGEGDILFVDTSHVSKIGSDVNRIVFEIMPVLQKGVVVHFHDIFYPFEYAKKRLLEGVFWNEAYLLHAFLMFNQGFEILMFNDYLNHWIPEQLSAKFPLCLQEPGASIWLRRV